MADPTKELQYDPAQQEAICHESGPMLVLAGPGSGKTGVITGRLKYLIEHCHVPPGEILVITFTRAAAAEMRQRSIAVCDGATQAVFGTFHSIFYHILHSNSAYRQYSIFTTKEKRQVLWGIARLYFAPADCPQAVEHLHRLMAFCKNIGTPYETLLTEEGADIPEKAQVFVEDERRLQLYVEALGAYERERRQIGKLDYDDILSLCAGLLAEDPRLRQRWAVRFSHIMIDEFQDINRMQFDVMCMLGAGHQNVFAVGDDDQSIYGFRGADPSYMKRFQNIFSGCRTLTLSTNYRSAAGIVDAAQRLIRHNEERFEKQIAPWQAERGDFVVREAGSREDELAWIGQVLRRQKHGTIAVLCRTNRELERYERYLFEKEEFAAAPGSKAGDAGQREEAETAADILSMLDMAVGGRRRADFFRFMNRPPRGISRVAVSEPVSFDGLRQAYRMDAEMVSVVTRLERQLAFLGTLDPFAAVSYAEGVMGYGAYIRSLEPAKREAAERAVLRVKEQARGYQFLGAFIEALRQEIGDGDIDGQGRRAAGGDRQTTCAVRGDRQAIYVVGDSGQTARAPGDSGQAAHAPGDSGRAAYAEGGAGKEETDRGTPAKPQITCMTYHGAKGLEFDTVILPGVNAGSVPRGRLMTKEALEEERRMFYVAMTRAKKSLYISYVRDAQVKGDVSPFIREIM